MFWKKKKDIKTPEWDIFKIGWDEEVEESILDIDKEIELPEVKEDTLELEEILSESDIIEEPIEENEDIKGTENLDEDNKGKGNKKGFFSKMFWKKKKDIKAPEDTNIDIKKENKWDSNIFDDFDINSELQEEVNYIKKEINKDLYDYLTSIGIFVKYTNLVIILIWIILFSYISVQSDETLNNSSLLDPICSIILGDKIKNNIGLCSSLWYIEKQKKDELLKLNKATFKEEIWRLAQVYKKENFINSKEVIFLLEKWDSRLRPLKILSLFDDLKNKFEPLLKSKILCFDLSITDKSILTASCYAYSTWWEEAWILWFNWDVNAEKRVAWTSISLASSFLNFLEKQDSELSILEKQKIFSIESIVDTSSVYTKRTPFSIKMKYSPKSNLSF